MSSLQKIQSQIQKLQQKAEIIRRKELGNSIRIITTRMRSLGVTLHDLQSSAGESPSGAKKSNREGRSSSLAGIKVPPRYRGPAGETWSGRGRTPSWMAPLLTGGKTKESFLIKSAK